jgi:uncharacterized protein (TIGR00725 family)
MTGRTVVVFGSSTCETNSELYMLAESVGVQLAQNGFDVMTGGYSGTMEAVSKGAASKPGTRVRISFVQSVIRPHN